MERRWFLTAAVGTVVGIGGCSDFGSPAAEPTVVDTFPQTQSEAPPTRSANSSTETRTHTPTGPFSFAFITNDDETPHQFRFTIARTRTEGVVFERTGKVAPEPDHGVTVSDEWLAEPGTYRVRCSVSGGGVTETGGDVDEMWACDHSVWMKIEEGGDVTSAIVHGDGLDC